jgi:ABC-type phosphate transport system substrate-binding protein
MRKVPALLGCGLVAMLVLSAACVGGSDNSSATPSPTTTTLATNAATATPAGSTTATPTAADLANDLATLRTVMQNTIAKAQAGDEQGTQAEGDKAIEAIIIALRTKDNALADKIETLKLDYDDNPDVTIIAQDAQKVLDLLGQVMTTLNISS